MKKYIFIVLLTVLLTSCVSKAEDSRFKLMTVCTIKLEAKDADNVLEKAFDLISQIEREISVNVESSYISRINQNAGKSGVKVSDDVYNLIRFSKEVSEKVDNAFDISVYPLVKLWGIGTEDERIPEAVEISKILPLIGSADIILGEDNTVFLKKEGMGIDLGAIGKGYITQKLVELFKAENVKNAIIDLGGNIYLYNREGNVGIQTPFADRGQYYTVVKVNNKAVVTSGPYERYFVSDGVLYHHIFDIKTGYPSNSNLLSCTIVSEDALLCDALSTAGFVLGEERLEEIAKIFKVDIKAVNDEGEYLNFYGT